MKKHMNRFVFHTSKSLPLLNSSCHTCSLQYQLAKSVAQLRSQAQGLPMHARPTSILHSLKTWTKDQMWFSLIKPHKSHKDECPSRGPPPQVRLGWSGTATSTQTPQDSLLETTIMEVHRMSRYALWLWGRRGYADAITLDRLWTGSF